MKVIEEHIRIITLQSRCNRVDIPANLNVAYRESKEKVSHTEVFKERWPNGNIKSMHLLNYMKT